MSVLHCCTHPEYSRGWAVPAWVLTWGLWYKIPHDITCTQDLMHTEIMGGMCGRGLWPTQEMFETLGKTLQGFYHIGEEQSAYWVGWQRMFPTFVLCPCGIPTSSELKNSVWNIQAEWATQWDFLHEPVWESGGRGVTQELFDWHMDFGSIFHSMPYWMMAFWSLMPFFFLGFLTPI